MEAPHDDEVHLGEPSGGHGDFPQLGDRVLCDDFNTWQGMHSLHHLEIPACIPIQTHS